VKIGPEEIEQIALGSTFLGTGGGGDPFVGKLLALDAVDRFGPVELVQPDEVPDDDLVIPSALMGAPTVLLEKIPNGSEGMQALKSLQARLGKSAFATMPIEEGGINSQIPIAVAASLKLPLVDCDGMGRAFPELQMVTFTLYGIPATPMVMVDEKGNVVQIDAIDNTWTERIARAVTVQMGGSALIAFYPMDGLRLKQSCVRGSVTLAMDVGKIIADARTSGSNPVDGIVQHMKSNVIFEGKVTDVLRRTTAGFAKGEATFQGLGDFTGKSLKVRFQNENLVATLEDRGPVAMVPDLISVLDLESGLPITTEGLRYGNRVMVLASPCDPKWRTPEGLKLVEPRYFGYDFDYVPFEKLAVQSR
jgi:DUF917 family protein